MMFDGLPEPIVLHIFETTNKEIAREEGTVGCTELLYCLRKAWLRRKYRDRIELTESQRWWIYRGNIFDNLWTSLFEKNQVEVRYKINDELTIVGHADFIYDDAVWELKTIATIKALWDRNEQRYKPKPWHVKQVLFYAHCLGLEKIRLCYISFDGYKIFTEQDFELNKDEVIRELVEKALEFHNYWKNDIPPAKTSQEWECKFCEVKQFCKEVDSDD
jgi:CRISPR/Cas system-associated exonuclease Cas4 (RecB family)